MTAPHPPPLSQKTKKTVILNPHTSEIKTFPHLTTRTPKTPLLVRKKKPWTGNKLGKRRCRSYFNPTFLILCLDRRKVFMLISNSAQWTKFVLIFSQGRSPIPFFMKVFLGPHVARQVPPPLFCYPFFFKSACRALSPPFCSPI